MDWSPRLAEEILSFWFGVGISYETETAIMDRVRTVWFAGSPEVDEEIRRRFNDLLEGVTEETVNGLTSRNEKLAMIILLDQFSRNIYRDSPRAFAQDARALGVAKEMIRTGDDQALEPIQRVFVYLALEHSEDREDQALSVKKYSELCEEVEDELKPVYGNFLDYAIRHKVIIDRFGRFPHRNAILDRASTPEERDFLTQPGSSF